MLILLFRTKAAKENTRKLLLKAVREQLSFEKVQSGLCLVPEGL